MRGRLWMRGLLRICRGRGRGGRRISAQRVLSAAGGFGSCQTGLVSIIPESHVDLLDRPLYCHLATVSAAGRPQANPMWFLWDGESLRFTHTNTRRKFRQLQDNPHLAISIVDPDNPARYLEVRATVDSIDDDFSGSLYAELSQRYGRGGQAPPDAQTRVAITATPYHVTTMG